VTPERLVDACLEHAGPLEAGAETRAALLDVARTGGDARFGTAEERGKAEARIVRLLTLIVASREYQFA
jgi:hypothetical protein